MLRVLGIPIDRMDNKIRQVGFFQLIEDFSASVLLSVSLVDQKV